MALEDSSQTGTTRPLGISTGEYQAVRHEAATFEAVPALVAAPSAGAQPPPAARQPNLRYVFDDPNDGEPGRDRMLVHGLWELVLALAIAGAGFALTGAKPGALGGSALRDLLLSASIIGLLAIASGLALRAAVPNLAVGGVAVVAGLWVAQHANGSWFAPAAAALGICAVIGLVQGLVVVGLHVPAWAASLGSALAIGAWITVQRPATGHVTYEPRPEAYLWFGGICALSVVPSLIGVPSAVRRRFSKFRPIADPARRRGTSAAVIALLATVVSTVLAGFAGVLAALVDPHVDVAPGTGLQLTALGLSAALVGGTSVFGRRGGIFGTIFAATLLAVTLEWVGIEHPTWSMFAIAAVGIGVGLAVSRLVERFGRPVPPPASDDDESWMPRVHALTPPTRPWEPGPAPTGGLWTDEGWGAPPR
jgi:ribose/xylose/arabinose/galactoside ABC-type transport system permease subunit